MSCLENDRWFEAIEERAYEDFVTAYDRDPTEDELEEMIECYIDKWL